MQRRNVLTLMAWATLSSAAPSARPASGTTSAPRPPLMLAQLWPRASDPGGFWVSEKYDGVRGYWDGRQLLSRSGERLSSPDRFTAHWPATALDGELWLGRGQFEHTAAALRSADDAAWQAVRYMVFDLPGHPGPFTERYAALQRLVAELNQPWVVAVEHRPAPADPSALASALDAVVQAGGEGLMLNRANAPYRAGRSPDLLKFKPHDDAEALVLAHVPGQGKYAGQVGALLVQTPEGLRFKLGSGLSDAQRTQPPAIGSWVTYRYQGVTAHGLPRFARMIRVRDDL